MSMDDEELEPPPKTLAWLTWYSEKVMSQIEMTPEEASFARDKGGKIIDFAMRGFWPKQKKNGIRHVTPAIACAYALTWLQQWASSMEEDAGKKADNATLPMSRRIEKIIHGVAENNGTRCAVVVEESPMGDVLATIRFDGNPAEFQLKTWRTFRFFMVNLAWPFWGADVKTVRVSPESSSDYTADGSALAITVRERAA